MQPTNPQNTPPQKLVDFNLELEALCKKYQYELRPTLGFVNGGQGGIIPQVQVFDKSPKQEDSVPLNNKPADKEADPADKPGEPATPPADNVKVN